MALYYPNISNPKAPDEITGYVSGSSSYNIEVYTGRSVDSVSFSGSSASHVYNSGTRIVTVSGLSGSGVLTITLD